MAAPGGLRSVVEQNGEPVGSASASSTRTRSPLVVLHPFTGREQPGRHDRPGPARVAVIAVPAGLRYRLAEVPQQKPPPAVGHLGVPARRLHPGPLDRTVLPGELHGPVGRLTGAVAKSPARPGGEPDRAGCLQQVEQSGEPPRRHPGPDGELAPGSAAGPTRRPPPPGRRDRAGPRRSTAACPGPRPGSSRSQQPAGRHVRTARSPGSTHPATQAPKRARRSARQPGPSPCRTRSWPRSWPRPQRPAGPVAERPWPARRDKPARRAARRRPRPLSARRGVHQARTRLSAHRRQHGLPLVLGAVKGAYRQVDFGPVEIADHLAGIVQAQPFGNLPAHRRRGGRGQRGHRGPHPERLDDRAQPQVVGAEIVAPRGDAVRLVHREQPHRRPGQAGPHVVARQLLRSQEDKSRPAAAQQRISVLPGGAGRTAR